MGGARTRVVISNGATLDGRIAASPDRPSWLDPRWKQLAGLQSGGSAHLDKYATNVHLEGSSSFVGRAAPERFPRHSGPPTELHADFWFEAEPEKAHFNWMAVPDSGGRVDWRLPRMEDGAHVVALVVASTPSEYLAELRKKGIRYLMMPGDPHVDLARAVDILGERLGVDTIVSTAGGVLNGVLLRLGLVDEIEVTFMPAILGVAKAPAIYEGYDLGEDGKPVRLTLLNTETDPNGSVTLHYRVTKNLE